MKSIITFWRKSVKPNAVVFGLAVLLMTTQPVWAKVVDRVVATVNGVIITLSMLQERADILKQQMQTSGNPVEMGEKKFILETLNSIVEEKLQIQEAKRTDIEVGEEAIQAALDDILRKNNITLGQMEEMLVSEGRSMKRYKSHIRNQILTTKVVQFHMGQPGKVSNKQIKKYYYQHQKDFWEPKQPFVRHILFIVDDKTTAQMKLSKREQANLVLQQVRSGANFSKLAKKHSEDISASSGGEVGWLTRGHLVPEFETVAFRLKSGEVSDIVESRYGYHIIKVDKIKPGKAKPLGTVKDKIEQVLIFEGRQKKYLDWMDDLKKNSMIQITLFRDEEMEESPQQNLERKPSRNLEGNWEEASNVKNKRVAQDPELKRKNFQMMERKLAFIKKLRKNNKITEKEYQARKQRLLDQL